MGSSESAQKRRVLVLGLDHAGKTALVHTIVQETHDTLFNTQGLKINFTRREGLDIAFWELPGLPHFRPNWMSYYDGADMMVFVVDSANPKRLLEAKLTLKTVLHSPVLTGIPLLVFANKSDRVNKRTPQQIVNFLKLDDIRDRRWYIQACSAQTGEGVDAGLEWLLTELKKGKNAGKGRGVTTRSLSRHHRDMLAEVVAAYDGEDQLTLRDIQLRFEKRSGILYAASCLLVALEEQGIPWKRVAMPEAEEIQSRQAFRKEKQQELQRQILMSKPTTKALNAAEQKSAVEGKASNGDAGSTVPDTADAAW